VRREVKRASQYFPSFVKRGLRGVRKKTQWMGNH